MTIHMTVHEERLSDNSFVYNVAITDDDFGRLVLHAASIDDAMRLVGKIGDTIRDHTTEVLTVTKWERAA